jgi:2-amino-4-hydroxy-6-hydroxymethyldihydropteridine diphosphokinase
MKYFLSLGSNIEAEKNLDFAEKELNKMLTNIKSSSIYKTKAEGFEGDDFLNSVICGDSTESFDDLNIKLKSIEDVAGRNRNAPKFSARTLDIDIVLQIDEDEEILFASDEIEKYTFVSEPLKELLK